jgi:hypothetical protein
VSAASQLSVDPGRIAKLYRGGVSLSLAANCDAELSNSPSDTRTSASSEDVSDCCLRAFSAVFSNSPACRYGSMSEMGHELPRRSAAGASGPHPITDAKACGGRDRSGP